MARGSRAARLLGTPRTPRGKKAKGDAGEGEAAARFLALSLKVWNLAPNEPGGDLLVSQWPYPTLGGHSFAPLRPTSDEPGCASHALIQVKTQPWGDLNSYDRRGCCEADVRAVDGGFVYRVACPVPKSLNDRFKSQWELIQVRFIAGKARLVRRWPLPAPPADKAGAKRGGLMGGAVSGDE